MLCYKRLRRYNIREIHNKFSFAQEGFVINFELLARKFGNIESPESVFSSEKLAELRNVDGLAIGEIAGRDSIAAIVKACASDKINIILPTVVYTGTEYGDWDTVTRNVEVLRKRLGGTCKVLDIIFLGNPDLWSALNGRYASIVYSEFGIYSPCLACHLYMHLCRVPLSLALGKIPIISGERDAHHGSIKLSQTPKSIDANIEVLAYTGIKLLLPIRDINDNKEVERLVGEGWKQDERQLKCTLSGNYRGLNKEVAYDEKLHERYVEEFLIPCGEAVINEWLNRDSDSDLKVLRIDYDTIIKSILANILRNKHEGSLSNS